MKSFYWVLTEGRIDWLKQNTPPIDTSHDALAKHRDNDSIIDHFATHADPSAKKQYTQWIVKQYNSRHFMQEDAPRVKGVIRKFEAHRSELPHQDIGKYNFPNLEDHLDKFEGDEPKLSKAAQDRATKESGATKIFSKDGVTVHQLHTHEAAKFYGAGTKWCTTEKSPTRFNSYSRQGPLYVVQLKGPQAKGDVEKYQFHFESNQFKDAKDRDFDLHEVTKRFPALKEVPQFQGRKVALTPDKDIPKHATTLLRDDFSGAGAHPFFKEEHFESAYNAVKDHDPKDWAAKSKKNSILEGGRFSDKFIKDIYNDPSKHSNQWEDPRYHLARNPNTSDDQLRILVQHPHGFEGIRYRASLPNDIRDHLVNHAMHDASQSFWSLNEVLGKDFLTDDHVKQLAEHPNPEHREVAIDSHWDRLNLDQRAKLIADPSAVVRKRLVSSNVLSPELQHVLYHTSSTDVKTHMARSTDVTPTLHDSMFNERDRRVLSAFANIHGSKLGRAHIHSIADRLGGVPAALAKNRHLMPHHVDDIIMSTNAYAREKVAQRADLSPEQMHRLAKDTHHGVLTQLARHKKLPQHLIPSLIIRGNGYTHNALFKRGDLTKEHLQMLANTKVAKSRKIASERLQKLGAST